MVAERNWKRGPTVYFQIFYILIHYICLSISQFVTGVLGGGGGERPVKQWAIGVSL